VLFGKGAIDVVLSAARTVGEVDDAIVVVLR